MLTEMKAYIGIKYKKPGNVYLGLVHRLDRPAGGVMVFARTSKAAARLGAQFQAHHQGRKYFAVAEGAVQEPTRLVDFLKKGEDGMVRVCGAEEPGAKRAELLTEPVAARGGRTLLDVTLMTGRAHQIRVQHAHMGHPLWGDMRYGAGIAGRQLALWAYSLSIKHPTRDEMMTFESKPPRDGAWEEFYDIIDARFTDAQG